MTVTVLSLDNEKTALLAHVVEQIEQNVNFLVSEDYLPKAQASAFLSTLSSVNSQQFEKITTRRVSSLQPIRRPSGGVPTPFANVPPTLTPPTTPSLPPRSAPAAISSQLSTCQAIWGFNEKGENPDELSFTAGEMIEIVEENSSDWWTGRVNGMEGLFPSSYVNKLEAGVGSGRVPPPRREAPEKPRYSNTKFAQYAHAAQRR
ncbi:SH3-domain-containing protein [Marasmius fiardii PR-910]|nr:SH3-domain-containing protein [Marasmius fiardii PR-910]